MEIMHEADTYLYCIYNKATMKCMNLVTNIYYYKKNIKILILVTHSIDRVFFLKEKKNQVTNLGHVSEPPNSLKVFPAYRKRRLTE